MATEDKWPVIYKDEYIQKMYRDLTITKDEIEYLQKVFLAAAQFYQIIRLDELFKIIVINYGHHIPEQQFEAFSEIVRHDDNVNFYYILSDDELFNDLPESLPMERKLVHSAQVDVDLDIFYGLYGDKLRSRLPYRVLPEEELLKYSDDLFYGDSPEVKALENFFKKKTDLDGDWLKDMMSALEFESKCSQQEFSIKFIVSQLERCKVHLTIPMLKQFIPLWLDFHNNMHIPSLNGNSPLEAEKITGKRNVRRLTFEDVRKQFTKYIFPFDDVLPEYQKKIYLENERFQFGNSKPQPVVADKIGRNAPCPCGSGKKYKKCCGRGK